VINTPEIFRKAARAIERCERMYSCLAISDETARAGGDRPEQERQRAIYYEGVYGFPGMTALQVAIYEANRGHHDGSDDVQDRRIMLLCLAAAVVEAGDLP